MNLITLEVKELGIVKGAKIDLKPFTIFFGENNTGKTYLAYLIYSICNVRDISFWRNLVEFRSPIDLKPIEKFLKDIIDKKAKSDSFSFETVVNYEYSISKRLVSHIFNNPVRFGGAFFKLNLPKRVKIDLHIEIAESIAENILDILNCFKKKFRVLPKFGRLLSRSYHIVVCYEIKNDGISAQILIMLSKDAKINVIKTIVADISEILLLIGQKHISERIKNVIFIPASKSGIFLLRKYVFKKSVEDRLSGQVIEKIDGQTEIEDIALPKPIIDFIKQTLIEKPKINEEFLDLVRFGEKHIVHGLVDYNSEVDEVVYRPKKGVELTPPISSALVVESIPLLTFLKYGIIKKGSLVIIEEPEAHLHPDAQRNLVRLLVRLVNRGVRVLLISHSPYVLQQINNCILINRLNEDKREKFLKKHGYTEEEALDPKLVSAYLFEPYRGRSRVKPLEIGLEGIPYDAFYSTLMELSKETRELRRLIYESEDVRGC